MLAVVLKTKALEGLAVYFETIQSRQNQGNT